MGTKREWLIGLLVGLAVATVLVFAGCVVCRYDGEPADPCQVVASRDWLAWVDGQVRRSENMCARLGDLNIQEIAMLCRENAAAWRELQAEMRR